MSLEQTAELYASVLRQLLPDGVYDTAEMTHVADDIYAHAKALAQADIDAHRLLQVLEAIPLDLLADYEREYGLPMQCMLPEALSIEDRLNVLKWVRTSRNVMNREYLEQLLAVFGVTLVHIKKYTPLQCIGSCIGAVDSERSRFKVLLDLQYPMTADMSCIIEYYLPAYLRVEWAVDMPYGDWILNNGYSLVGDNIRYTVYKTNQRNYYDSYADFDLVTALVRSFHDENMQQWQGVQDAIQSLNGFNPLFNNENNTITVAIINSDKLYCQSTSQNCVGFKTKIASIPETLKTYPTSTDICAIYNDLVANPKVEATRFPLIDGTRSTGYRCVAEINGQNVYMWGWGYVVDIKLNPNYGSNAPTIYDYKTITYDDLALQLLSNLNSSNQGVSLNSEVYIQYLAESIFGNNPSQTFVNLHDVAPQFEHNKILRTYNETN